MLFCKHGGIRVQHISPSALMLLAKMVRYLEEYHQSKMQSVYTVGMDMRLEQTPLQAQAMLEIR